MQDTAIRFEETLRKRGKRLQGDVRRRGRRPAPRRDGVVAARPPFPVPPRRFAGAGAVAVKPSASPGVFPFVHPAPGSDVSAADGWTTTPPWSGAACADDAEAVRALVDRFQAEVYGLCVRLLGHRHDAEDVTQEVFLRVFRSLRRWDSSRPLRPWVMGIAVNRCRTWMAQRVRRPELADYLQDTAAGPAADDSAELLGGDPRRRGRPAARTTAPCSCCSTSTASRTRRSPPALDRPVGTIKTWLHRARLEVLEHLKRRGMVADETVTDRVSSGTPPNEG